MYNPSASSSEVEPQGSLMMEGRRGELRGDCAATPNLELEWEVQKLGRFCME